MISYFKSNNQLFINIVLTWTMQWKPASKLNFVSSPVASLVETMICIFQGVIHLQSKEKVIIIYIGSTNWSVLKIMY